MKVSMFHLCPYRDLPADFEKRYQSSVVDPPFFEVANPEQAGRTYNETLDELIHAAKAGLDGICVNEHHQAAYGFMASPNLMASALARATRDLEVAIVVLGATMVNSSPPIRVAEEYAMLDCISGGRLVAGLPLGSSADSNLCYGITPIEQREMFREAHELLRKAWSSRESFAWNGKYTQLPLVNLWPRPIQQPPPIWVPGAGSLSTWEFVARNNYSYSYLSYFGHQFARSVMDGFWEFVDRNGLEPNPYRAGFLQLVVVSETDAQAAEDYEKHLRYFYDKCLHFPPHWYAAPGYMDHPSLVRAVRSQGAITQKPWKDWKFKDFVDNQFVIGGSPASVRQQLEEAAKSLRVGNLMVLLQIGSMPHELTLKNIDLFAREVLPHVRDLWDDQWENHWWPEKLRGKRNAGQKEVSR
ncbi:LLM class flavin-dependent oxidoreductase [Archangium violaceum]|uniref:LLM class flavin-dependent oxidoreductase n=1 Tax=Archangium violaceum TaxID=83451 RepID=UPI00193C2237|nr:LLM class flavin-dependent oxidoreductase [Archangium violaceum]QRK09726.1 LLM class flavin-dependent oxidoreductase [Archangium violaceum]